MFARAEEEVDQWKDCLKKNGAKWEDRLVPSKISRNLQLEKSDEVTKTGYLVKQGRLVKNWKRRYFVLHNYRLSYYKAVGV